MTKEIATLKIADVWRRTVQLKKETDVPYQELAKLLNNNEPANITFVGFNFDPVMLELVRAVDIVQMMKQMDKTLPPHIASYCLTPQMILQTFNLHAKTRSNFLDNFVTHLYYKYNKPSLDLILIITWQNILYNNIILSFEQISKEIKDGLYTEESIDSLCITVNKVLEQTSQFYTTIDAFILILKKDYSEIGSGTYNPINLKRQLMNN